MEDCAIVYLSEFDPIDSFDIASVRFALVSLEATEALLFPVPKIDREDAAPLRDRMRMMELAADRYNSMLVPDRSDVKGCANIQDILSVAREILPEKQLVFMVDSREPVRLLESIEASEPIENVAFFCISSCVFQPEDELLDRLGVTFIYNGSLPDIESGSLRGLSSLDTDIDVITYLVDKKLYRVPEVREMYSRHRYEHAISVAELAYRMALHNSVDPWKAYLAGYLHDVAKELAKTPEGVSLMKSEFPEYASMPEWSYHQFLGAYVAKEKFGVRDEEVLQSIFFHTTGSGDMSSLDKIIYCADKLDPFRGWDSQSYIQLCMQDIDLGFRSELQHNMEYIESKDPEEIRDHLTSACVERYLKRL